jgi:hypothetical protein
MEFFCPNCEEMPIVNFSFIKKGIAMAIIKCKCGRKFHDLSTFIVEYTNILKTNKKTNAINNKIESDKSLQYFCETCFQNIYCENISEHQGHKLIKIDKNDPIITEEKFNKITIELEKAENKVMKYLPNLRDMLLKECSKKSEKVEIQNLSDICIYKNNLLIKFIKMVYNLYKYNKNIHTLTYQMMINLKENVDFNLNKYNLDIKNIKKERFISFLKSCIILCCNSYINRLYENFMKEKEELLKMILKQKPISETNNDKTPLKIDEMMKSNSSIYYGEKSTINNLAYGRGVLICANGSHYFGYFKNDFFQNGLGKSINKEGNTYFGQFKEGTANGYGKFTTKNGNKYIGEWVNNKLDGFGYISIDNKEQMFFGEIKKGLFNGIGQLYNKKGFLYKGGFKDGKMDGTGMILYKSQKKYLGELKEGNKEGYGIMIWPTEERYEGSWENDSFKFGYYSWPNGNIFLGDFKNDSVNGFGTFYSCALGTIETGSWKNGKREEINHKDNIPSTRYLTFL